MLKFILSIIAIFFFILGVYIGFSAIALSMPWLKLFACIGSLTMACIVSYDIALIDYDNLTKGKTL